MTEQQQRSIYDGFVDYVDGRWTFTNQARGIPMGYMKHHAIVVTSWKRELLELLAGKARDLGLQVLGASAPATNDYSTLVVCPDGSKEEWPESDEFELKRARFMDALRAQAYEDGSSPLEWVLVAYGRDDRLAAIVTSAWADTSGAVKP